MISNNTKTNIPFLSRGGIELKAAVLLEAYRLKKGRTLTLPIPVESILEGFLKLKFSFMDMREVFGVDDVVGALWMESGEVGVDHRLDPDANPRSEGRYNFTIAHEIGHWLLHRRYKLSKTDPMLPYAGYQEASPTYVCRSSTSNRAEIQANLFASSLLMPKPMVVGIWQETYGEGPMDLEALRMHGQAAIDNGAWDHLPPFPENEDQYNTGLIKAVIEPLASKFHVSGQAMQIRLDELGLLPKRFPLMLN